MSEPVTETAERDPQKRRIRLEASLCNFKRRLGPWLASPANPFLFSALGCQGRSFSVIVLDTDTLFCQFPCCHRIPLLAFCILQRGSDAGAMHRLVVVSAAGQVDLNWARSKLTNPVCMKSRSVDFWRL